MVNLIGPGGVGPLPPAGPGGAPGALPPDSGGKSFKDLFLEQIDHVNQAQLDAQSAAEQVLLKPNPSPAEIDQVMVAARKAQLAFESLMQVRNKLVDAFEELMRMRI